MAPPPCPTATGTPFGDPSRRSVFPLDLFGSHEPLSAQQIRTWIWILVALGVAARLVRFALRLPLWCDEAFLSANFLDRGFLDMFRPLEYHQVCPLLFLWAQLAVVKLLGFTEYTLRLFPLISGLATLALAVHVARRMFRGTTMVLAVGMFATSYAAIRYSAEAKPYGSDLLVTLGLIALLLEWWRQPHETRWLWAMVALTPLALGLAYPMIFVAPAISGVVGLALWRRRDARGWIAWIAWNVVTLASVLTLYFLCIKPQATADLGSMRVDWAMAFPPLGAPGKLLRWLIDTHTSELFAHPIGGAHGASLLTTIGCVAGLVFLLRRRMWLPVLFCAAPLAVNFVAAALQRYPYGGHVRLMMYYGPMVCLLAALGGGAGLAYFAARGRVKASTVSLVFVLLSLIPLGSIARDFSLQGKTEGDIRARDFARWFWFEMGRDAELVCLKTDLGLDFYPPNYQWGYSSLYVCNQRIYSPRLARHTAAQLDRVTAEHPLRCVEYRPMGYARNAAAADAWLAEMSAHYTLVSQELYPISHFGKRERDLVNLGHVAVYEFVPRDAPRTAAAPAPGNAR